MPRHYGGRPRHNLSTYVTILKKTNLGDKDRQCLCNCCVEVLKDDAKPIVNRKERIRKHLMNCEHFWNKYKEEAEEIIKSCNGEEEEIPPAKNIRLDGRIFIFFNLFFKKIYFNHSMFVIFIDDGASV
jgi:hypothetical protein